MRRWLVAIPLAIAAPAAGQVPAAFAGVPHVAVRYYHVAGQDAGAIRASLDANRPTDPQDGTGVDALTHWAIGWRWRGCDLAHATVRFSATVTMPRLSDAAALPPDLLARWQAYLAALEAHEASHVRYAYAHRGQVLAAIRAARCTRAPAAGQAVLDRLVAHDVAFDRETLHGQAQGASFP